MPGEQLAGRDDGLIAVSSAVFSAGIALGLFSLTMLIGQGYMARQDALKIADLVSSSLAYECAVKPESCTRSNLVARANELSASNTASGLVETTVVDVCGPTILACAPQPPVAKSCAATTRLRYVRVSTRAQPRLWSFSGSASACAQATWGQVARAPIAMPLVFHTCSYTKENTVIQDQKGQGSCASSGFFVTVKTDPSFDATCSTPIVIPLGSTVTAEANSSICRGSLDAALFSILKKSTLVPLTDSSPGTGSFPLRVASYGNFYLEGYRLGNPLNLTVGTFPAGSCTSLSGIASGGVCLYGRFMSGAVTYVKSLSGPQIPNPEDLSSTVGNYGVVAVLPLP